MVLTNPDSAPWHEPFVNNQSTTERNPYLMHNKSPTMFQQRHYSSVYNDLNWFNNPPANVNVVKPQPPSTISSVSHISSNGYYGFVRITNDVNDLASMPEENVSMTNGTDMDTEEMENKSNLMTIDNRKRCYNNNNYIEADDGSESDDCAHARSAKKSRLQYDYEDNQMASDDQMHDDYNTIENDPSTTINDSTTTTILHTPIFEPCSGKPSQSEINIQYNFEENEDKDNNYIRCNDEHAVTLPRKCNDHKISIIIGDHGHDEGQNHHEHPNNDIIHIENLFWQTHGAVMHQYR